MKKFNKKTFETLASLTHVRFTLEDIIMLNWMYKISRKKNLSENIGIIDGVGEDGYDYGEYTFHIFTLEALFRSHRSLRKYFIRNFLQ